MRLIALPRNWIFIVIFLILGQVSYAQILDTLSADLAPIEITSSRAMESLNTIKLSRTEFLSHAASFDDPSRLLMKYPSFTLSNDQNNAIIYDGLPSHYSSWSLYGAEIVNPNHLSSAGMANDRPSRASGGVNMFSGQVLGGLNYYIGEKGPLHGIGGIADMSMRTPYANKITANISLIGIEAGLDRLINDSSSFLANYRYSTVGLLGNLGVDLGDELITYQDVSTEYRKQWSDKTFRITANYGYSTNDHAATANQDSIEAIFKDIQEINYSASNFISAATVSSPTYDITLAYSSKSEDKTSDFIWNGNEINNSSVSDQHLISLYVSKRLKRNKFDFDFKLSAAHSRQNINSNSNHISDVISLPYRLLDTENPTDLRLAVVSSYQINDNHKLSFKTEGYATVKRVYKEDILFTPELIYSGKIKDLKFNVNTGIQAQRQAPELTGLPIYNSSNHYLNRKLKRTKAFYNSIEFSYKNIGFRYFKKLLIDVPTSFNNNIAFVELSKLPYEFFSGSSDINIDGINLSINYNLGGYRIFSNYTFMNMSSTTEGIKQDLSLAPKHLFNLRLDKKYTLSSRKTIRLGISYHHKGSTSEALIDPIKSQDLLETIYDGPYTQEIGSYQRLDLRISYLKKGKYQSVISLDIQNVLNRQNDGYYYYDPLLESVELQKQLGLIPILSWRLTI